MLSLVVIRAQDLDRLARFYAALGFQFTKHRHGAGPEHLSSTIGETVFEIYPSSGANESTVSTRLGFSVPSLTNALGQLRGLDATVLVEPSDNEFGRRAVVKDFEGHKVALYERAKRGDFGFDRDSRPK
jgi:lactoylglutathione lyase